MVRAALAVGLLVLGLAPGASAATRTVCAAGPPSCDFATIQAAVDVSAPQDVVEVQAGTYPESVSVSNGITVRGPDRYTQDMASVWEDEPSAVVTGDGTGAPAFAVSGAAALVGIEVSGVTGANAYGVTVTGSGTVDHVYAHDNTAGMLSAPTAGSTIVFDSVLVRANGAVGAGSGRGVVLADSGTTHVSQSTIEDQAVAGVVRDVPGPVPSGAFVIDSYSQVARSTIGIDAVGLATLVVGEVKEPFIASVMVGVASGGTGIRVGDATVVRMDGTEIYRFTGATSTVGLQLVGTGPASAALTNVSLMLLDTPIDIGSSVAPSTPITIRSSQIRRDVGRPALVSSSPVTVDATDNLIGCASAPCSGAVALGSGTLIATPSVLPVAILRDQGGATVSTVAEGTRYRPDVEWHTTDGRVLPNLGAVSIDPSFDASEGELYFDAFYAGRFSNQVTITATVDGVTGPPATVSVIHATPDVTVAPRIVGDVRVGSTVRCAAPKWGTVAPTSLTYSWFGDYDDAKTTFHTGATLRLRAADLKRELIKCRVHATFAGRLPTDEESGAESIGLMRRVLVVRPVNARGRAVRCGATKRHPCVIRAGQLVRFALPANPVQRGSVRWYIQWQYHRRWIEGNHGSVPTPSRYYVALRTKGAPRGLYRVRSSMPAKGAIGAGSSRWVYWRIR
jgi:hypothetical protein